MMDLLSAVLVIILGFTTYLAFSLPVILHDQGFTYWKARAIYHTFIFSTLGLSVFVIRNFLLLILYFAVSVLLLIIHKFSTQNNPVRKLYDFMRRDGVSRSQRGLYTVITNCGLLLLLLVTWNQPLLFGLPLLILAFSDKIGEAIGRTEGEHEYEIINTKTFEGSFAVFLTTIIIITLGLFLSDLFQFDLLPIYMGIGVVVAVVEAISVKFLDNLLIPFSAATGLYFII